MKKLFDMSKDVFKNKSNIILVQIDEAHSTAWPMYIDNLLDVEVPEPQKTFKDRVDRANYFVENYNPPYEVHVDGWNNEFAEMFRAWPDKYHCVDNELTVIAKSDYHSDEDKEALIVEDYTDLLTKLFDK